MTRADAAWTIARRVADRVGMVAPPGLGRWEPAWSIVEFPSLAFLDALHQWEVASDPSPVEEKTLRSEVRRAATDLVAAWADAAVAWEAAGKPRQVFNVDISNRVNAAK
jgi:hypothetical protein